MKKLLKQLLAVTTAIMMAITLLPAMANAEEVEPTAPTTTIDYTGNGRLTINKTTGKKAPLSGAEFTVYKIASLDETNGYQMLVTAGDYITPESLLNLDADEQMAAAAAFKKVVTDDNIAKYGKGNPRQNAKKETDANGNAIFDNLDLGYYLVVETKTPNTPAQGQSNGNTQYVASAPFFVAIPTSNTTSGPTDEMTDTTTTSWVYDVTAKPKNEEVGIDKKIVENGTNKDKDTVAVGDTINYEITSISPKYTKEYFQFGGADQDPTYNIHDILSDGLTLNENTIKVTVDGTELKPTTDYSLTTEAHKFDIAFTVDFLRKEEYKGATVKVNYSVTVNENAVVGTDGNTNDVSLDYSRKPDDPTTGVPGKTTPKVYTYGLKVYKKDSNGEALTGAKFKLYKVKDKGTKNEQKKQIKNLAGMDTNGVMIAKKAEDNGEMKDTNEFIFSGLDVGDYELEEVESPKGYTLLTDTIKFSIGDTQPDGKLDSATGAEIETNTGYAKINVTNKKGFNLPSTGGMGTYIFTIGGLVVMAGAVLLLVSSKKKRA